MSFEIVLHHLHLLCRYGERSSSAREDSVTSICHFLVTPCPAPLALLEDVRSNPNHVGVRLCVRALTAAREVGAQYETRVQVRWSAFEHFSVFVFHFTARCELSCGWKTLINARSISACFPLARLALKKTE